MTRNKALASAYKLGCHKNLTLHGQALWYYSTVENHVQNSVNSVTPTTALNESRLMSAAHNHDEPNILGIPGSPGTTNTPGDWAVTDEAWLKDKKHWTDSPFGKAAIEFISRITLGGLFYSLMENSKAMERLGSYERYNHAEKKDAKFLEKVAYGIDNTIGKGMYKFLDKFIYKGATIEKNGHTVTKARNFLRFRENRNTHHNQDLPGRSIGAEMTVVTASFAAMSVGSALMRNFLSGVFSPKERASWTNNGKFDPLHIAKKTAGKIWEIGTYNAGEDMAVALPYVLYMRGQRNVLDKVFHGFRYSSDSVDNGGGLRLDDDGKVNGHFLFAGAADLQGRFTTYNVFTQLYRDVYNSVGNDFKGWWKGGKEFSAPEWIKNPLKLPENLFNGTKRLVRYTTVSTIRSLIQMTPSVPFFSIFRVPGSKTSGMAVNSKHGALHFVKEDGTLGKVVRANLGGYYYKGEFKGHDSRYNYLEKSERDKLPAMAYADGTPFNQPTAYFYKEGDKQFDPHGFSAKDRRLNHSFLMRKTDSIAKWMHKTAEHGMWEKAFNPLLNVADKLGFEGTSDISDKNSFLRKRIVKDSVMAGIPYASYFAAKVYTRETYVNEQMNMAVERLLDGVLSFSRKEIAAGFSEISNAVMRQPLEDPERQALLIEKHLETSSDTSPRPIDWSAEQQIAALKRHDEDISLDKDKVIKNLNKERSDYYSDKIAKQDAKTAALAKREKQQDWASKQAEASEVENAAHLS